MKLIADSGSTKTTWVLMNADGSSTRNDTEGYNPYYLNTRQIAESIKTNLLPQIQATTVTEIFFYGAGVSTSENIQVIRDALSTCFSNANIFIGHDLLASCRALLGKNSGFAAILGTGCNTAIYDGSSISLCIDSLGHHLGDEGSGAYIGRLLLRNYLRGYFPKELNEKFKQKFPFSKDDILKKIYFSPLPNRYCASFTPFAGENKTHPFIHDIVSGAFHDFFLNIVTHYPNYKQYTFNCVGSIGFVFKETVSALAEKYGMKTGTIIQSPIEGLVKYHSR